MTLQTCYKWHMMPEDLFGRLFDRGACEELGDFRNLFRGLRGFQDLFRELNDVGSLLGAN